MNYIMRLQNELAEARAELAAKYEALQAFRAHIASEKFCGFEADGCAGRRIRHLRPVQIATAGRLNSPPEAGEFATPDRRHRAVGRGRTGADKQLYLARREIVN